MTRYNHGIFNMTAEAQTEKGRHCMWNTADLESALNYQESRKATRGWEKILATNRLSLFDVLETEVTPQ